MESRISWTSLRARNSDWDWISVSSTKTHIVRTHNANIIKREAGDRVVYKVFFSSQFAVLGIWLEGYCASVWKWVRECKRTQKASLSCLLNHWLHISQHPLGQKLSRGVWKRNRVSWKAPYSSGEWLCWLEPEPIEKLSWPHTVSQPGSPALITRLGHANTWYQNNASLCYCQIGFLCAH